MGLLGELVVDLPLESFVALLAEGWYVRALAHYNSLASWSWLEHLRNEPGGRLEAVDVSVPGDFSSAAFLLVAATLVPGSEVLVEGVGVNPTRTGLLAVIYRDLVTGRWYLQRLYD